jgi:hypothetical protein
MKTKIGKLIKANGELTEVSPANGKKFGLDELQKFVGGYIEILSLGALVMVVNEEGKLNGLPVNLNATDIWGKDVIVGDVLICSPNLIK